MFATANSRAELTPQTVHWTLFGSAVSLSRSEAVSWLSHGLRNENFGIFKNETVATLSKVFYVRSAHSRATLTPRYSMPALNLLPKRLGSKPQAEWLLHRLMGERGGIVSLVGLVGLGWPGCWDRGRRFPHSMRGQETKENRSGRPENCQEWILLLNFLFLLSFEFKIR